MYVTITFISLIFVSSDQPVQKLKQRYNNPRSLNTTVDLTKLSEDLRMNPSYVLCDEELRPGFGGQPSKQQSQIKSTIGKFLTSLFAYKQGI